MDHLREEYDGELTPPRSTRISAELLTAWIHDAEQAGLSDPTAMCLATLGRWRPTIAHGALQGCGRHHGSLLHQLDLGQGQPTSR